LTQHGRLLRPGDCVVELGAWPGGWLQVAAAQVGPRGRVVGVDLQAIHRLQEANVVTLVGDISDEQTRVHVARACGGRADVLLADLAPKLTGIRARDDAQTQALADCVLQWVAGILRPQGILIIKLFSGEGLRPYVARLRSMFREVHLARPQATRKGSAELYAVASGFQPSKSTAQGGLVNPRPS
jgi:23S rRNA (uridine2552-2'-O)-methyltransferase